MEYMVIFLSLSILFLYFAFIYLYGVYRDLYIDFTCLCDYVYSEEEDYESKTTSQ